MHEAPKIYFNGKKYRFLVVDDEPTIREVISLYLTHYGQEVITAIDGDDCVKKISPDIDIILLDVKMPGKRSDEIIEAVKKKAPHAVIIYLTSVKSFEPTKVEEQMNWKPVLGYPVIGYISKPVMREELLEKIEKFFKRSELVKNMLKEKNKKK